MQAGREIKFRVWDKEQNKMLGPNFDREQYAIVSYNGLALLDITREDEDGYDYEMDVEWLQYTGLSDMNGKEIYEGDVIEMECGCDSEYGCSHGPYRAVVKWSAESASFELEGLHGRGAYVEFEDSYEDEYLVIGNIYENPELLEAV
ncbi:YopX family protein [uncultured Brevibacillus sp.]|uniref:YopX family protein n=1 Tax=uncultured Brevibacillus sp. TaxID=169970 RepID=UPI002591E61A|nr:YopX family protein [uncultured Brevibacillus sp.]